MTTTIDISESMEIRKAFSTFPSGVAALSAVVDGTPKGLVASSFTVGVSLDPPLVSVAVQNSSTTWPFLRSADRIGISILGIDQEATCRQMSSKKPDKFDLIAYTTSGGEAVRIPGYALWLECSVFAEYPAGDHTVALLEVHHADVDTEKSPLIFHDSTFKSLDPALRL